MRRALVGLIEAVLVLVACAAIGASVLAWRLSEGPLPLDLVRPYIEQALVSPDGTHLVHLDSPRLVWRGWQRPFDITADDLTLQTTEGAVLLAAPDVSVLLSAAGLLRGRIEPIRLSVGSARLAILRAADGALSVEDLLGRQRPIPLDTLQRSWTRASGTASSPIGSSAGGNPSFPLDRLELMGANLTLRDQVTGREITVSGLEATLTATEAGFEYTANAAARTEGADIAFTASGRVDGETWTASGDAAIAAFDPAVVLANVPQAVDAGMLSGPLSGTVAFEMDQSHALPDLGVALYLAEGSLNLPDFYSAPVGVRDLRLEGTFRAVNGILDVTRLDGMVEELSIDVTGQASGLGGDGEIILEARVGGMAVDDLDRWWPITVGPKPRKWVVRNLEDGRVPEASIRVEATSTGYEPGSLKVKQIGGRIDFNGVTVHYLDPLPVATDARGFATFDQTRFDIQVEAATLSGVDILPTTVVLSALDTDDEQAFITLNAAGALEEILTVLDHEPLGYPAEMGIRPSQVGGSARTTVTFRFPLIRSLSLDELEINAIADIDDAVLPNVVGDRDLSKGDLDLTLDLEGLLLEGTGTVGVVPLQIKVSESFGGDRVRITQATGKLGVDELKTLGVDLSDIADGHVDTEATIVMDAAGSGVSNLSIDMTHTGIVIPEIGWAKPRNVPAPPIRIRTRLENHRPMAVEETEIDLPGLTVRGSAAFTDDGERLARVVLADVAIDPTLGDWAPSRFSATIEELATQHYKIDLTGDSLDLRPLQVVREAEADDLDAEQEPWFRINFQGTVDALHLKDLPPLSSAQIDLDYDGEEIRSLAFVASVDEEPITLTIFEAPNGRSAFRLQADNAGRVLEGVELLDTVVGGSLLIEGTLASEDGDRRLVSATLRMTDFSMVDAPLLARILGTVSLRGLGDALTGKGIPFDDMTALIEVTEDRATIRDGMLVGPSFGISADGIVDRDRESLAIEGTVVPAYSLNRVIDSIPILGRLLTGGKNEGLIAASYRANGPIRDPDVAVNPLTALAPGFVRNLAKAIGRSVSDPGGGAPLPTTEEPADLGN